MIRLKTSNKREANNMAKYDKEEIKKVKDRILEDKRRLESIYIFGAGILGNRLQTLLDAYKCMGSFVDNSIEKQKQGYCNCTVISADQYIEISKEHILVIAVSTANTEIICRQMENLGLEKNRDYYLYNDFINRIWSIISVLLYNKSYISLAQITVTERCTLKCKKCAHACYAVDNKADDMSLMSVYRSADSFFKKVDYINEFVLIGGEPFLYKELSEAINYVGKKYRKQILSFAITTNGTLIPKAEVLDACKKYDVLIRISNYSIAVPWVEERHLLLINELEKWGIKYILQKPESEWMDYGFEYVNREASEKELIRVFDQCKTPCREVRENKLYYCVMARSVSENLEYNIGLDDYLDLDKLSRECYKEKIMEFQLGYSEKGYLDMCNHCHGGEAKKYPIPAGEQLAR